MRTAVTDHDDANLGAICERLLKVLAVQPMRINNRLLDAAKQLALGAVAEKLRWICSTTAGVAFDEEAQARLGEFTRGIESIGRLDHNLQSLIQNHNCLQEIDDLLRPFALVAHPGPREIADTWIDVRATLGALSGDYGATWLAAVKELAEKMDPIVARPPTEPKAARDLEKLFHSVSLAIYRAFNQTDEDLRRFCEQLQKVGDTLSSVIGRLQHA
jgi:hypothetical protein